MADTENQEQVQPQVETKETAIDYEKLASILDGRQKATEDSVLKGYFKEQGLTDEQMAQAVKDWKDKQAAEAAKKESDYAGMQTRLSQMEQDIAKANQATLQAKVENVVILEATKMGIAPKWVDVITRMADLSDVGDANGNVSAEKIANAISKVADAYPEMKPSAQEQQGFKVGLAEEKSDANAVEQDKLKAIFGVK